MTVATAEHTQPATPSASAPGARRTLVYIMSPSYSGSTLLTFLLGTHPQIATVGELKASALGDVETYDCSCGTRIRQCPFWQRVGEEMRRRGVEFDVARFGADLRMARGSLGDKIVRARVRGGAFEAVRRLALAVWPGCARSVRAILDRNRALIEAVCTVQGRAMFLDGSKDPVRLSYLLNCGAWNLRVIYLIRDGRGATCSYMKHTKRGMAGAAGEWRRTHEQCDRLVSRLSPGDWLRLRYEDLCREPERRLDEVFRFLGLESAAANRDFYSVEHHILGNAMRLRSSSEITLDEKWKSTLTPEDLAAFDDLAGDLNHVYGYD